MSWMVCRYHFLEIMFEAVVAKSTGISTGPDILMFKRFKNSWISVDHNNIQTAISNISINEKVINRASDIIEFAKNQLEELQPRDDSKECLELTITFLGGVLKREI
ncbi:hypothetical protein AVEN_250288-1 [Araneus ventricosus]|uniref:Uncharacterized protein n=1 Tax=Araneus ventricosus TaxID=182803 RepID=A0A4Y2FKH0_ARAVE|nr:hypothetical protein AVEN_250288-1 [Araneus ventricosus]